MIECHYKSITNYSLIFPYFHSFLLLLCLLQNIAEIHVKDILPVSLQSLVFGGVNLRSSAHSSRTSDFSMSHHRALISKNLNCSCTRKNGLITKPKLEMRKILKFNLNLEKILFNYYNRIMVYQRRYP